MSWQPLPKSFGVFVNEGHGWTYVYDAGSSFRAQMWADEHYPHCPVEVREMMAPVGARRGPIPEEYRS